MRDLRRPMPPAALSPALIFKGSGFYTTDYARKDQTRDKDDGASDKKPEDKKAEPKS